MNAQREPSEIGLVFWFSSYYAFLGYRCFAVHKQSPLTTYFYDCFAGAATMPSDPDTIIETVEAEAQT